MKSNLISLMRYRVIDRCLQRPDKKYIRTLIIDEIEEEFRKAGIDQSIGKRQFLYDLKFMKSKEGWAVEVDEQERVGKEKVYRYRKPAFTIGDAPIHNLEVEALQAAKYVLDRFRNRQGYEWVPEFMTRIEQELFLSGDAYPITQFEENKYTSGIKYRDDLSQAIAEKVVLEIPYQPFGKSERVLTLHPYILKEYNNRWWIVGKGDKEGELTNLALDRIVDTPRKVNEPYVECEFDLSTYYQDLIGVTRHKGKKPQKVQLRVSKGRCGYFKTKPLHESQSTGKEQEDGSMIFRLDVIINLELIQQLLAFGPDVQVLKPVNLVRTMRKKSEQMQQLYAEPKG